MSHFLCACFNIVVLAVLCRGSEFLKKERHEHVSQEDIRISLLSEVESTLGAGSAANRVRVLEAIVKPMYASLPKNEHGRLGHSSVRYALHRLFTLRHGWHIKGLGRDAGALNITSPLGVLKDQVPAYIQDMFEKRLGDKGLGLQELAVMAATMEHLIHQEAVGKLGDVFGLHMVLPTEQVDESKADELLDTYMMAYILGNKISNLTLERATAVNARMPEVFVGWHATQAFVRRIRNNITDEPQKLSAPSSYNLSALAKVVAVVGEEFGTFQDADCRDIKNSMMKMEFRGTGRVRLADFYRPALAGNWQFQESVGYLRQLGALDDSDPDDIRVIIVNYIHSQANCIAASGFYSVCCKDECEGLFGHLEEKLSAPDAPASAISALVKNLASSTVDAPRNLSWTLLKRLDDIATEHGGMVPLHGRLFAQWMHHAYPRECPFPHVSGTTSQITGEEFVDESGVDSIANEDEMAQFTSSSEADQSSDIMGEEELLPWSPEEELLVQRLNPLSRESGLRFAMLRPVVLLAVVGTLALSLVQAFKAVRMHEGDTVNAKFIV